MGLLLDSQARRRLAKRLYIPLPDAGARRHLVLNLLKEMRSDSTPILIKKKHVSFDTFSFPNHYYLLHIKHRAELDEESMKTIVEKSAGYSGSDLGNLCKDAALGPIRSMMKIASNRGSMASMQPEDIPPITIADFEKRYG